VLLNGGKIAGILLESAGRRARRVSHLVVGVGVNLAAAPDAVAGGAGALTPVSLKAETGIDIAPEHSSTVLAPAFDRIERQVRHLRLRADPDRVAGPRRAAGETSRRGCPARR
jgi:BirA family biotin operon repressor/biotin-[acetyl-CoA-carboxylase] ligase